MSRKQISKRAGLGGTGELAVATWRRLEEAEAWGGGVVVLALPPFHCVTLDKSLAFSGPQLPVSGK